MGFFGTISDIAKQISKTTPFDFDGITKAMKYNANDVAKSYAGRQAASMMGDVSALQKQLSGLKQGTKEYDEVAKNLAKAQKEYRAVANAYKSGNANTINSAFKDITEKDKIGVMATLDGYFNDKTYGGTRKKVALGAGAAAAVGTRYLSGGNMTTNAQGERDIAGIPFI